tara:strand:+ start:5365 stop:6315 length:951 start_codon:yes stop_codon:yes gene_type:complete
MIVSGNFADLLEPTIREIFDVQSTRPDPVRDLLFDVQAHDRLQGRYTGIGARRLVPVYTGEAQAEDFDQYYRTDITNFTFVDGVIVDRQMLEDDEFGEIVTRSSAFADSFADTQEDDAMQVFSNGFTDSGTNRMGQTTNGADGVALMSTAHPYSPRQSGTTQSNEGTLQLNLANAETTRVNMAKLTGDKGQRLGIRPDTILVPVDLEQKALQVFPQGGNPNVFEPGSAEFDVSIFASRIGGHSMTVIVWNLLTDTDAWFMMDSRLMKQHLKWQERVAPSLGQGTLSDDEEKVRWNGRMRYGMGWTHWSWIYGQNPS